MHFFPIPLLMLLLFICLSVHLSVCFNIFIFSWTTGPILTKLGTKHPWVKGIQFCSNEGPRPFPRGDNYQIAKIHWQILKIYSSRTAGPISTKLGIIHPWVKGIQVCSNEGLRPFLRKLRKCIDDFKKSSPEPLGQFQPNLAKIILGSRVCKIIQMKGQSSFQGEMITK